MVMKSMPQVSAIVPIYNVEKYLHRCIDSILAQTFADFELILADDGRPGNLAFERSEEQSEAVVWSF